MWPIKFFSYALAASLLFSLVSITAMESFLALAFVFWVIVLVQKKEKFAVPGFFWPLVAYAGLSLVACFFSVNPEMSFKDARELLLYLFIPMVMSAAATTTGRARTTLALLASGYLSIIYSFCYYALKAQPGERIKGFMGHYMTQAGLLLLFLCAAMSFFVFSRDKLRWLWTAAIPLAGVCLALTLTRSAWIGFIVAASLILLLWKPKTLILLPVVVGLVFLLAPQPIKRRALSIFSLEGSSNRQRIQYLRAGVQIIKERPVFGTGPDTVDMVFQDPKYGLSAEARRNVHLHNNIIQIGAERGIPTLTAWLVFIVWAFLSLLKLLKNRGSPVFPHAAAAAAALLALMTAGLFEYNFADSEITVLFLYLLTVPFAASRKAEE
jgi:O-antigen ligase